MDFDYILQTGEVALIAAEVAEQQEGLQLDFKLASGESDGAIFTHDGRLGKEGRRIIGKAISAFANSAGGLIVIGVNCRKNSEGVDCVSGLAPFPNWNSAVSALNSSVGELLQPKHDGIRVGGFASVIERDKGYVIIDVLRSERRPHMCQANKHYYKRSGASSFAMEHYDIEDAFRRTAEPVIEVVAEPSVVVSMGDGATWQFRFWLKNVGSVSVSQPALETHTIANFAIRWGREENHVDRVGEIGLAIAYGSTDFVIHPGQSRVVETIQFDVDYDNIGTPLKIGDLDAALATIRFQFFAHALHMPTRQFLTEEIRVLEAVRRDR